MSVDTVVFRTLTQIFMLADSGRPMFDSAKEAAEEAAAAVEAAEKAAVEAAEKAAKTDALDTEQAKREARGKSLVQLEGRAPRDENGELIFKRREVHSGRAISVSTVEWSVAENAATPTSALEGFMWDKETEVDRFRERVPLTNLVSQCNMAAKNPDHPKPRDWIGQVRRAAQDGFVMIPECKRIEPMSGSLWKRYDIDKLVKMFLKAGVQAMSVNCDQVLFGGTLDDITRARKASVAAARELATDEGMVVPPILASDLVLYPYQLYKFRLAGADAVNLLAGALASKDMLYLSKIAKSLQIQVLVTVTSEAQVDVLNKLPANLVSGLIVSNRELEDFGVDMTGQQAIDLLNSKAVAEFRERNGEDIPILVEGQVGLIERTSEGSRSSTNYITELEAAGAAGAIVGRGIAEVSSEEAYTLLGAKVA